MLKKISALSLALVLLVGCGGGSTATTTTTTEGGDSGASTETPAATTSGGQVLRFGTSGFEGVFNPILSDNVYDSYVCEMVFDGLVGNDPTGEYIPELATWELSDDHLTYTFTLKDGVKFSNGTPLDANDVAFTYNTIKEEDYAGPRTAVGAAIANIEVIDDKTIAFTMVDPSPANIQNFTYGILEDEYYAHTSFEDLSSKNNAPMGSGKLVLDSWEPKQFVSLTANPDYWDAANKLKIEGVLFTNIEEDALLLAALQNGDIDFCQPQAKAENVEQVEAMPGAHLVSYLANGYTFMCFNTTRPTLEQKEVRQALLYALDRPSFLTAEYGSDQLVSLGMAPISKTSWAYPGDDALNRYDYDLDKAAQMLEDAGWTDTDGDGIRDKNGVPLELNWLVYHEASWPGTLSGMAYDSWGKIGVKLNIQQMDFNTVAATTMDAAPGEKDFDIYTMGFSLSIDPDPTGGLFDADAYSAGGFNASGFRDERSQELIKAGLTEFDQDKRAEIYKEWAVLQNELVPTAIVAYRSEIWAVSDRVHGLDDIGVYTDFTQLLQNITLD